MDAVPSSLSEVDVGWMGEKTEHAAHLHHINFISIEIVVTRQKRSWTPSLLV